ncbi:aspartate kinase [Marinactinospora thermotolerans]|uniref:Aspartokinase n=1 Tax=Marinactinospora thermotolerans DSM 45154 TaxID=1122192 RepID=A0A1T4R907_9ACTN|nr:aspartate kinase [Marinactinospora thermotolerans]SKA12419.1 aspartate kinase [Marinactinospora thermotolerans DSM 45154]
MRTIRVQKFGGTSLTEVGQILQAAQLVREAREKGASPVVCVSARGATTDRLLAEAEAFASPNARELDQLLSTGEIASAAFMAMALQASGVPAVSLTGGQAGIDAVHVGGETRISAIETRRILAHLAEGTVVVVAGFQGHDEDGDVRTLGRGGSDTTAVALAVALGAGTCEIYTDVHGVYTADPRVVPDARVLPEVPHEVMSEMSISGARVLHSRAVELAAVHGTTITVGAPDTRIPGTIVQGRSGPMLENAGFVYAVTHDPNVAKVGVRLDEDGDGLGRVLLDVLHERLLPLHLTGWAGGPSTGLDLGFVVRGDRVEEVEELLRRSAGSHGLTYTIDTGAAQVSVVGVGLLNRPGLSRRILRVLGDLGITTEWMSLTQSRASVLVPASRVDKATAALHEAFGLGAAPA